MTAYGSDVALGDEFHFMDEVSRVTDIFDDPALGIAAWMVAVGGAGRQAARPFAMPVELLAQIAREFSDVGITYHEDEAA